MPGPLIISGTEITVLSDHPKYGRWVSFPDIGAPEHLHAGQKWIPHEIEGRKLFRPDDLVEVKDKWMAERIGVCVAHVSRFRWWAYHRHSGGYPLVELHGAPLQWYAASFFKKIN